jgi:hypothetical protein
MQRVTARRDGLQLIQFVERQFMGYIHFTSAMDFVIGTHVIHSGDKLMTFKDNEGLFWLVDPNYSSEPLARFPGEEINRLAKKVVIPE